MMTKEDWEELKSAMRNNYLNSGVYRKRIHSLNRDLHCHKDVLVPWAERNRFEMDHKDFRR